MNETIDKIKNSEKMTSGEKRLLKAFIKKHGSMVAAASALCIDRSILYHIRNAGSGHSKNIAKIRAAINPGASN